MVSELELDKRIIHEEIANSITHGFGALLSVIGTAFLLFYAYYHGKSIHFASAAIYGITLIMLYSASTVYHAVQEPIAKKKLKILDHACIYLLIAGSYTPFTLITLKGTLGFILLSLIWTMAISGVIFKMFFYNNKLKFISTMLYLFMGWTAIFAIKPLINNLPTAGLVWVIIGGISYTIGTIFYLMDKKKKYFHAVWHLFVLGGSVSHFIAIAFYVIQFKFI